MSSKELFKSLKGLLEGLFKGLLKTFEKAFERTLKACLKALRGRTSSCQDHHGILGGANRERLSRGSNPVVT